MLILASARGLRPEAPQRLVAIAQPARHGRHVGHGFGVEDALDRAAVGMAADDDVGCSERRNGILDARRNADRLAAVDRRDVAGVAFDEQFAGSGLGDHRRHDAGVGAGQEQRLGLLGVRKAFELLPALREYVLAEASDAARHRLEKIHPVLHLFRGDVLPNARYCTDNRTS